MITHVQEVTFPNQIDNITIAGTLTLPKKKGPFPVAMLIAGMGPMDRDATFMGHKRFAIIADYLTQAGIAILRVDKRGVGKSTGKLDASVTSLDLARDVRASIDYLKTRKEIDPKRIGLIGHSEGGLIAIMVAAESKDVAFIVSMSGAIATSADLWTKTSATQLRFDGASEAMVAQDSAIRKQIIGIVIQEADPVVVAQKMDTLITQYWAMLPAEQKQEAEKFAFAFTLAKKDGFIATFNSPWFRFFFTCDAVVLLRQIKIPLLALNGEFDFNNTPDVFYIIRKALQEAGNTDYTTLVLPKLNHNFQTCQTGSIPEYGALKESIAPAALQVMAGWINARFGNKR